MKKLVDKIKGLLFTKGLVSASLIYLIANGIGQGTTLLANVFFTRYMSRSDYGLYSNYYSYVSILVPFVGMNLYLGLTNAYMDYKQEIKKLRSSVLLLSLAGVFLSTVSMLSINAIVGISLSQLGIILAIIHAYGFFLINYFVQSMNMENKYWAKGLFLSVPNILQAIFAAVAVLICNSYVSRAIGGSISIIFCGIFAAVYILRKTKPVINLQYWKYALCISLPSIIGSISAMIMQQCDKVMITSLIGPDETAIYALIYNIGYILYAVLQATSGVWQVWIYNAINLQKTRRIPVAQKWYLYFMMILASVLYMVSPEAIKILSPKEYWHFEYVIPFIIGSYCMIMYSIHMSVTQYLKKTGINSIIVTMAAVVNVALNYCLIPKYGGLGAACTSVVSYFLIFVTSGIYLSLKKQYYFKLKYSCFYFLLVFLMGGIFYVVRERILVRYIVFGLILMLEGLFVYRKKKDITFFLNGREETIE